MDKSLDAVDQKIQDEFKAGGRELQTWMVNAIWDLSEMGIQSIPTDKRKHPTVSWSKHVKWDSLNEIKTNVKKYTLDSKQNGTWCVPSAVAVMMTNRFIGIDIDKADDLPQITKALKDNGIDVEQLYQESTKRGFHLYLWLDRELTEDEAKLIDDIPELVEFKHKGTLMMLAGSVHKSGVKCYKAINKTVLEVKDYEVNADSFLSMVCSLRKAQAVQSTGWVDIDPSAPRRFKHTPQDIVAAFNLGNPIESMLQDAGYSSVGNGMYTHPNNDTNGEGSVSVLNDALSYHHGANDPLRGKGMGKDGSCFSAFGLYVENRHSGDFKSAVKAASVDLGMNTYEDGTTYSPAIDKDGTAVVHNMNEKDTAAWFCGSYGDELLYSEQERTWYYWTGKYWKKDVLHSFLTKFLSPFIDKDMDEYMMTLSDAKPDDDKRKKSPKETFNTYISRTSNFRQMRSIEDLSKTQLSFPSTDFDLQRDQLCCSNGTIDLKTGELLKHRRADHHTKLIDINFDPKAVCESWTKSLEKICADSEGKPRPDVVDYIQKCLGYSITGEVTEQCIFVCHGQGRNGKTYLLEYIEELLGGFGKIAAQEVLLQGPNTKSNSFAEAELQATRFALASETREGERLDSPKVKRLTNKTITADRKFERQMQFSTTHKLWIDCNHKPVIKEADDGTWRRIRLIPFDYQLKVVEVDSRINEKWDEEKKGILAWLVEGSKKWYAEGLGYPPQACADALEQYRAESDYLLEFMEDRLDMTADEEDFVSSEDMYDVYKQWSQASGYDRTYTKQSLKPKLLERGLRDKRKAKRRGYSGVTIKTDYPKFSTESGLNF
jgi:P4 family phage/plasmid primase-like protien